MNKKLKIILIALIPLSGILMGSILYIEYNNHIAIPWYIFEEENSIALDIDEPGNLEPGPANYFFFPSDKTINVVELLPDNTFQLVKQIGGAPAVIHKVVYQQNQNRIITQNANGFQVYQVNTSLDLQAEGEYSLSGDKYCWDLEVDANYVFLTTRTQFLVLDIRNMTNISTIYSAELRYGSHGISLANGYAYVAAYMDGVFIYDISDMNAIFQVSTFAHYGSGDQWRVNRARNVFLIEEELVVFDDIHGLVLGDAQENPKIVPVENQYISSNALTIKRVENFLMIADENFGLKIFEQTETGPLSKVETILDKGEAYDIVPQEQGFLFLHEQGLSWYDILPGVGPNPKEQALYNDIISSAIKIYVICVVVIGIGWLVNRSKLL